MSSIKDKDGVEYLWQGNPEYWSSQAPVLFPIVGAYVMMKLFIVLVVRPHFTGVIPRHGLVRKKTFTYEPLSENSLAFSITPDAEMLANYPYDFELKIIYTLTGKTIKTSYQVTNRETEKAMPYFIGGHPGFNCPLLADECYEDYYLEFGEECYPDRIGHTEACFLSGENKRYPLEENRRLRLRHELFDEDAIVLQSMADRVTLKTDQGSRKVTLYYPQLPYLGIWHVPKTTATLMYCVEPWTSLPSRRGDYRRYPVNRI